jgi:hypothetical protein
MLIAALVTTAKIWNQPKCPSVDEKKKKENMVYVHNGIRLFHKKKEILSLATTWIMLENIMC